MLKNIILLSTILLATNAFANVNWSYVGADANASYYVSDIESEVNNFNIKNVSLKKVLKTEFLVDKVTIQSNTFKPMESVLLRVGDSIINQEKYNCIDIKYGTLSSTPYVEGRGLIIGLSSYYNPVNMLKIKKSSIQDKIYKLACK